MQMVASGYGVTLVPEVAIDVELRDDRVKLLRFAEPQPSRSVGLVWRRTSPRELDFKSLGQIIASSLNGPTTRHAHQALEDTGYYMDSNVKLL
jgi:LysR family hydrogen peroxide-inducible transcriptional activator